MILRFVRKSLVWIFAHVLEITHWNEQINQIWINGNVMLYLFLNLTHASPSSRLSGQGSHNPSINICINELKPSIIHWNVTIYTAHGQENALSNVSRLFSFWRVLPSVLDSSLDGVGISTFTATTKIGARCGCALCLCLVSTIMVPFHHI